MGQIFLEGWIYRWTFPLHRSFLLVTMIFWYQTHKEWLFPSHLSALYPQSYSRIQLPNVFYGCVGWIQDRAGLVGEYLWNEHWSWFKAQASCQSQWEDSKILILAFYFFFCLYTFPSIQPQSKSFQRLGCIWLFDDGVVMVMLCTQNICVGLFCAEVCVT